MKEIIRKHIKRCETRCDDETREFLLSEFSHLQTMSIPEIYQLYSKSLLSRPISECCEDILENEHIDLFCSVTKHAPTGKIYRKKNISQEIINNNKKITTRKKRRSHYDQNFTQNRPGCR